MAETTKTYRIRTDIGSKLATDYITLDANLVQDYDAFDILSVKINSVDTYKLHNANYGVVVGRVLANNGFGIPNAKISIFISSDGEDGAKVQELYSYTSSVGKNADGVRYNLLPDEKVGDCHQIVGTFPNKRYALDNDVILEVFDKYYKYTTRTNNAGDYLIMGVPTGSQTLHMDLDLSDCGILSQRPRDFVYKGYTIEQFENPNMFKDGTDYPSLSQIFTQDQVVNVRPFWGNSSLGEELGITRADIDVAFTFQPTCVFMGSVISDNSSQGITKKCMGTEQMGNMEELVTGEGTIEMIRMTPAGNVEEFQVKGTQLINGNGVWCYQIPMNLDYMMTDEYGNMVPTDDPEKGIPTRTRVRFRISMQDNEENVDNFFRSKVLVPHNPQNTEDGGHEDYDYEFGSLTREDSFRDLFWNNVYSVKSYIPRFQKRKILGWKDKRFVAIKNCNFFGSNNPIPYNNIRIRLTFMFSVMCAIIKTMIFITGIINTMTSMLGNVLADIGNTGFDWKILGLRLYWFPFKKLYAHALNLKLSVLKEGLCPDLDNWYFAPMWRANLWEPNQQVPVGYEPYNLLQQTLDSIMATDGVAQNPADNVPDDTTSIDYINNQEGEDAICLTISTEYLISCIEMNLAMEYRVINFDFYNDWLNGTIYFPRFMRYIRPKVTFLGIRFAKAKVKGCMDDTSIFAKTRRYTQQCTLPYKTRQIGQAATFTNVLDPVQGNQNRVKAANNYHKSSGFGQKTIFGANGGICHESTTMVGQKVYYMKPCEWTLNTSPNNMKVNLFATDIILLGSLNDCDIYGIPQAFKYLAGTSYILPTNLALTNMEENGPLYANDKGTLCSVNSTQSTDGNNAVPIKVIPQDDGLSGEIVYFSGANAADVNVQYDGAELSDIIALTEAAGISWNYTGPGQGSINDARMYTPGGHFLGLSCAKSQTNIKSCINLQRICEVGANLSQRREDTSGLDNEGNLSYSYSAPSGFISGDDIVGADFRAMFATMNQNRLIATKINPNTGYKMYDFTFVKPINFDGAFKSVVDNGPEYNQRLTISEQDKEKLREVGIEIDNENRPDADNNEELRTQIRTIEDTSTDYYMFRMGLKYDNLSRNDQLHLRKFLLSDGGKYYLPQYENSYYFYFGLKGGATAIDEFNKEYFSVCESDSLLSLNLSVVVTEAETNLCNGTGTINVICNNLETPYQQIKYWKEGENHLILIDDTNDDEGLLNTYQFTRENLSFGKYTFVITDANGVEVTGTGELGTDIIRYNIEYHDFNCVAGGQNDSDDLAFRGGYIEISNLKINGLDDNAEILLQLFDEYGNPVRDSTGVSTEERIHNTGEETAILKCDNGNVVRYLYAIYDCDDSGSEYSQQRIQVTSFTLKDGNTIKLYMGFREWSQVPLSGSTYTNPNWFTSLGSMHGERGWVQKYCTFNTIIDDRRGLDVFTNNVVAENGTKVIWGTPQNSEGFYRNNGNLTTTSVTYCSETYNEIPEGYSLDDEYSYYSTYRYEKAAASGTPLHYSAQAYNGTQVYGDYYAKLTEGTVRMVAGKNQSTYFSKGYGYIFKPLPEGELQFFVYNGSKLEDEIYDIDGSRIMNGVYYPSYIYPVIARPFFAVADFYVWQDKVLNALNSMGAFSPNIGTIEKNGRTEIIINNGITSGSNYYFGSSSTITNIRSEDIGNLSDIRLIRARNNDMYGASSSQNRETYLSGYTENSDGSHGVSGLNFAEYNITDATYEGNASYSNSISDYVSFTFAKELYYRVGNDDYLEPVIDSENDMTDDDIEYYIGAQVGGVPETAIEDKILTYEGGSVADMYFVTTDDGRENIPRNETKYRRFWVTYYDSNGAMVIVKIEIDWTKWWGGSYNTGRINVRYTHQDGWDIAYVGPKKASNNPFTFNKSAWDWCGSHGFGDFNPGGANDKMNKYGNYNILLSSGFFHMVADKLGENGYTLVRKVSINFNAKSNRGNNPQYWKELLERDIKNAIDIPYDTNANYYYGIGKKYSTSNNDTIVYKIYPSIANVSSLTSVESTPVQTNISELKFDYTSSSTTILVYCTSTKAWSSYSSLYDEGNVTEGAEENAWAQIEPEEAMATETEVTLNVAENTEVNDREIVFTFTTGGGGKYDATVTVQQRGKPVPFGFNPSSIHFDAAGGTRTIQMTTNPNYKWSVDRVPQYLTVSPMEGSGRSVYTIRFTISQNTSETPATIPVTFYTDDERISTTEGNVITITQDGAEPEEGN